MAEPKPPFIATIGYVRSLKISRLTVTCEGKRAGCWDLLPQHGPADRKDG